MNKRKRSDKRSTPAPAPARVRQRNSINGEEHSRILVASAIACISYYIHTPNITPHTVSCYPPVIRGGGCQLISGWAAYDGRCVGQSKCRSKESLNKDQVYLLWGAWGLSRATHPSIQDTRLAKILKSTYEQVETRFPSPPEVNWGMLEWNDTMSQYLL